MRTLVLGAAVIALALSPSISECISAHQEDHPHKYVLWGWVLLVAVLAFAAGETLLGVS